MWLGHITVQSTEEAALSSGYELLEAPRITVESIALTSPTRKDNVFDLFIKKIDELTGSCGEFSSGGFLGCLNYKTLKNALG